MGRRRSAASVKISESRVRNQIESYPLSEPCPDCGKLRYLTRKAAKGGRRRTGGSAMTVYRCGDYWHIGHTPYQIKMGYQERSNTHNEWKGRRR